jgi:hypothetical protein
LVDYYVKFTYQVADKLILIISAVINGGAGNYCIAEPSFVTGTWV